MKKRYPFKFLDAYESDDSKFYFGRDTEIEKLYEMVFQTNLLMVYGTSGTGKTSLINCGLASKFQSHDWDAIEVRRGNDINEALEKVLAEKCKLIPEDAEESENWLSDILSDDIAIVEKNSLSTVEKALRKIYINSFKPIYLVFDQFEELFILGTVEEQEKFLQTLIEITDFNYPITSIIVTREEYLGHFYEFEKKLPQLFEKKLRVEPMTVTNLKAVMEGIANAKESNVDIEEGKEEEVSELIFDKLRSKKRTNTIQLPYLQVFLDNLYLNITGDDSREKEATITLASLNNIGDIDDVLKDFLVKQVDIISEKLTENTPNRPISVEDIWTVLMPLTTMEGTKEPQSKQQLFEKITGLSDDVIGDVIEECSKKRILRHNDESDIYEVAHDALALTISTKRSESDVALIEIRGMIKNKMALGSNSEDFFTPKQISLIEPFLEYSLLKLTPQEQDLFKKSKENLAKKASAKKTRKILYAVAAGVFLLTLYFGNRSIQQQRVAAATETARADFFEEEKVRVLNEKTAVEKEKEKADVLNLTLNENIKLREYITAIKIDKSKFPRSAIVDYKFESEEIPYDFSSNGKPLYRYNIRPFFKQKTNDWSTVIYKLNVTQGAGQGPNGSNLEMRNSLFMAGEDKGFQIDYDGYTCVNDIIALIEFKDPQRSSEIVLFNGCKIILGNTLPERRGK